MSVFLLEFMGTKGCVYLMICTAFQVKKKANISISVCLVSQLNIVDRIVLESITLEVRSSAE